MTLAQINVGWKRISNVQSMKELYLRLFPLGIPHHRPESEPQDINTNTW